MANTSTTSTHAKVTTDAGDVATRTHGEVRITGTVTDAAPVESNYSGPIIPREWTALYTWQQDRGWELTEARATGGKVRKDGTAGAINSTRRWSSWDATPWRNMPDWLRDVTSDGHPTWEPQPLGGDRIAARRAARAVAQWEIGDPLWADVILDAAANPEAALARITREGYTP